MRVSLGKQDFATVIPPIDDVDFDDYFDVEDDIDRKPIDKEIEAGWERLGVTKNPEEQKADDEYKEHVRQQAMVAEINTEDPLRLRPEKISRDEQIARRMEEAAKRMEEAVQDSMYASYSQQMG